MLIKITTALIYDINNPNRQFTRGQVIKVNDEKRAKDILARKLGYEVEESEDFIEFDVENTKHKEVESEEVEENVIEPPKPDTPKKTRTSKRGTKPSK
ncbi:hypothetical protein ABGF49_07750 [Helcococcus ovis]|uniref:hypothetical protein n=1 Tax=Helcococcus TaxID=31983 RepID=UPI0038BE0503